MFHKIEKIMFTGRHVSSWNCQSDALIPPGGWMSVAGFVTENDRVIGGPLNGSHE
jgi:hypothetical protein